MRITIRYGEERDLDEITDMVVKLKLLNEELDPHFKVVDDLEDQVRRYVEDAIRSGDTIVLVAEDEDTQTLAGVIIAKLIDRIFYKPRMKVLITDFYVKPVYRRKRLGTLLLERIEAEASRRGAGIVTAVYPAYNSIAEHFYETHGFDKLQVERYKPVTG
ncbi:MAG: GNAT family N-acetyltransferase [Desulfurococcales archaeon]|nr:GNAT family N-acetyltransferase [Desulfurococcales archaeon]